MKKRLWVWMAVLLLTVSSCGEPKKTDSVNTFQTENTSEIDVDLTELSSTMVYSEVYNMVVTPEAYVGKTIKMRGKFSYYEDPQSEKQYFACVIVDATACCAQGLEFVLRGDYTYPDDYPTADSEITVIGTFEVYQEDGAEYYRLVDAVLSD